MLGGRLRGRGHAHPIATTTLFCQPGGPTIRDYRLVVVQSQSGLVEHASAVRATAAGNGERNARAAATPGL